MTRIQPLLLQAAFTIETLAHLQGHEELLPQAQQLRKIYDLSQDADGELTNGLDDAAAAVRLVDLITEIESSTYK